MIRFRAYSIVPFLVLLAGCETIVYRPVEVKVPVPVPCTELVPEPPAWKTETATPRDLVEKVGVLEAEIEQHRGYEERLIGVIKTCRHDPAK